MRKVFVSIDDCIPGMQMAETIYNEFGAVIVAENTILDQHLIGKMSNFGITSTRIYEKNENIVTADNTEIFKAQYRENVDVVKDMIHDISSGRDLDTRKVKLVADSILIRINENRDIVQCIQEMKNTDEYTYTHSVNVSLVSMLIGKWMKMNVEEIGQLVQAGLLHDVGKGKVPLEILNKPGALGKEEYEEMKKHTVHGYRITEAIPHLSEEARKGILMHHERGDGSGYPLGLKNDQISHFAKIIAVADIYDAMTSKRIYQDKKSPFEVMDLLENNMFGVLDTKVVKAFLQNIAAYYIGDKVMLSNGEMGEIAYINPVSIARPLIKAQNQYIDLSIQRNVKILEVF